MKTLVRSLLALTFGLFLYSPPSAFAQYGGCYMCTSTHFSDGSVLMFCDEPDPLIFGREYCFIDDDPWLYCQTFGPTCCIDPM